MDLYELRVTAFMTQADAARLCDVSIRTWRRWENGYVSAPRSVVELFNLLRGELSLFGWSGWYFNGEKLYAPDLRNGFSPGDIRRIEWDRHSLANNYTELRHLKAEIAILQNRLGDLPQAAAGGAP